MTDPKQIAAELAEIQNAPVVNTSGGSAMRCGWCGQLSQNLHYVETVHGQDRYKGDCCYGK